MKRISYGNHSIVTGSETADALIRYAMAALSHGCAVAVEIPVLEENGLVRPHTLLLGPAAALEVVDIDGRTDRDEADAFPLPDFPTLSFAGRSLPPEEILDLDWVETA